MDLANQGLKPGITPREELVLKAYRLLATVLRNIDYLKTDDYKAQRYEIDKFEINPEKTEEWLLGPVWKQVMRRQDLHLPPEVEDEVYKFLHDVVRPKINGDKHKFPK